MAGQEKRLTGQRKRQSEDGPDGRNGDRDKHRPAAPTSTPGGGKIERQERRRGRRQSVAPRMHDHQFSVHHLGQTSGILIRQYKSCLRQTSSLGALAAEYNPDCLKDHNYIKK